MHDLHIYRRIIFPGSLSLYWNPSICPPAPSRQPAPDDAATSPPRDAQHAAEHATTATQLQPDDAAGHVATELRWRSHRPQFHLPRVPAARPAARPQYGIQGISTADVVVDVGAARRRRSEHVQRRAVRQSESGDSKLSRGHERRIRFTGKS